MTSLLTFPALRPATWLAAVVLLLPACAEPGDITLSSLFTDGLVIQRDAPVPVWGTARPGAGVSVRFMDLWYDTAADDEGTWEVVLNATAAGGPYELHVVGEGFERTLSDVLVGDVWVASGQSNMEWTVASSHEAEQEIASADDAMIRQFKVPHLWAATPADSVVGGPWVPADTTHVGAFTAAGYYFAREIRAHHDVPIGILNTSWGGSRIEPWMSAASLGMDQAAVDTLLDADRALQQARLAAIRDRLGSLPATDQGLVDDVAVWADPDMDDRDWERIAVPSAWEAAGFADLDGIAWYRTAFDLSADEAASGVTLGLGMIDDSDRTWVNGTEVGGMDRASNVEREYAVAPSSLREGRNVIAVRVVDTGGRGGIVGSDDLLYVDPGTGRRPLAGDWAFRVGEVRIALSTRYNRVPVGLYNAMIHPFLRFPVKGIIWYQGEANAGEQDAYVYRDQFATMIQDWRDRWGVGDFPFLFVQLAGFRAPAEDPAGGGWGLIRESQAAALSVANTAQAVTIDIGEANDIHPRNKQEVGRRLALAARALTYGENIVYSGPVYRTHTIENGRVVVSFDHVGGGLRALARPTDQPRSEGDAAEGLLTGFAIAGADGRFVWADARIEGDRVVVSSPTVRRPVAVRYGWASNPDRANLYNAEGLPASPFRTDRR